MKLQINLEKAGKVLKAIKNREGYCPCRTFKTSENICVCEEVRNGGECICGLFLKEFENEE